MAADKECFELADGLDTCTMRPQRIVTAQPPCWLGRGGPRIVQPAKLLFLLDNGAQGGLGDTGKGRLSRKTRQAQQRGQTGWLNQPRP